MNLFKNRFNEKKARKEALEQCYEEIKKLDPKSDEYKAVLQRIIDLQYKQRVNPNTLVTVGGSLLSIAGIIFYEGAGNVIKNRNAFSLISKIKF